MEVHALSNVNEPKVNSSAVTATELMQSLDLACGTSCSPAAQSRHHLRTVQTTAE